MHWRQMSDWWWVMAVAMTVFWGVVVWTIVRVVRTRAVGPEEPESALRRRLARGEITEAEYRRLSEVLGQS